jgi:hypothetical protein
MRSYSALEQAYSTSNAPHYVHLTGTLARFQALYLLVNHARISASGFASGYCFAFTLPPILPIEPSDRVHGPPTVRRLPDLLDRKGSPIELRWQGWSHIGTTWLQLLASPVPRAAFLLVAVTLDRGLRLAGHPIFLNSGHWIH